MSPVIPAALSESMAVRVSDLAETGAIGAAQVAGWLLDNPAFFETHAELLADMRLRHGVRGKTVSLIERQVAVLREKNQALEARLDDLIRIGQDNDTLGARLQQLILDLLRTGDARRLPDVLAEGLRNTFAVPQVAVRLWRDAPAPVSAGLARKINEMAQPYCGPNVFAEAAGWLPGQGAETASVALFALREHGSVDAFGVVVLGSPDAGRFQAGMGTAFLERLAELSSASLSRLNAIG